MSETEQAWYAGVTDELAADLAPGGGFSAELCALEDAIAELAAHLDAATFRLLRLIRAYDAREGWAAGGARSCAEWLSFRLGWGRVTAREKLRVARALDALPQLRQALGEGRVSYSKVRALTRIATPENEGDLLAVALAGTAAHVERLSRIYRRATCAGEREEALRQQQQRYLRLYTDAEGMLVIRGRLPPEVGAVLQQAVEAACQALAEQEQQADASAEAPVRRLEGQAGEGQARGASAEAPVRRLEGQAGEGQARGASAEALAPRPEAQAGEAQLRDASAEALVRRPGEQAGEAQLRGASAEALAPRPEAQAGEAQPADASAEAFLPARAPAAESPGTIPPQAAAPEALATREQLDDWRRADALQLVCETALGHLGQAERGEAYQVVIHVDAEVLAGEAGGGQCYIKDSGRLAAATVQRLTCDCATVPLAHGAQGQLDAGRRTRRISPRLWRALSARDQTCQFPGCSCTKHLAAHHIRHWARGGETDRDNLVLLCRRHHTLVHEGGFRVEGRAPDGLRFYAPSGQRLASSSPRPALSGDPVAALQAQHARAGLNIGPYTLSTWQGERMDYNWAVDSLARKDGLAWWAS